MELPEPILDAIKKADEKYPGEVDKSINYAMTLVKRLSCFEEFVGRLVRGAIQEGVYDVRHSINRSTKNRLGIYSGRKPKVISGKSKDVARAAMSVYLFRIAGTTLGTLYGHELPKIAESQQSIGNGFMFNHRLCKKLAKLVPDDKRVQEVISEPKLRKIFKSVEDAK